MICNILIINAKFLKNTFYGGLIKKSNPNENRNKIAF